MKKISLILLLICITLTGALTSCSEDYPGPDPVDVTSNYSNKFSNRSNLSLTYSGEQMIGKSIDFSTVKGETANITLYDILPGEKNLSLRNVPLEGTDNAYTFSGEGTGSDTNIQFHFSGKVEKGYLTFNLTDVQTAGSSQWANNYRFSEITRGVSESLGVEVPMTGAGFVDTKMAAGASSDYNVFLRSTLAYFLPQILNSITLQADGNILAEYSTDGIMINGKIPDMEQEGAMMEIVQFIFSKLLGGGVTNEDVALVTNGRTYSTSPANLVYWYPKDNQVRIKLNLPAIITLAMKGQGKMIDENLLSSLTDIIFTMDPVKLKEILTKINGSMQNGIISFITDLDDATFNTFFEWITVGIPMNIESVDGHTHLYLDKATLQPILDMIPSLVPVILDMLPASTDEFSKIMLSSLLNQFAADWRASEIFNIGLDLVLPNE